MINIYVTVCSCTFHSQYTVCVHYYLVSINVPFQCRYAFFPRVDQNLNHGWIFSRNSREHKCSFKQRFSTDLYTNSHMGTDLNCLQILPNRKLCREVKLKVIQLTSNWVVSSKGCHLGHLELVTSGSLSVGPHKVQLFSNVLFGLECILLILF